MTSRKYGNFITPLLSPLCHTTMAILLTSLNLVSQKYWPPSPYLRDVIYEWSLINAGFGREKRSHWQMDLDTGGSNGSF